MANEMGGNESIIPMDALPASPMIRPHLLQKWFPNHYDSISIQQMGEESEVDVSSSDVPVPRNLPKYQMYRTRYNQQTWSQHGGRERYCGEDNMTINRIKLGCTNNRYGSSNSNRLYDHIPHANKMVEHCEETCTLRGTAPQSNHDDSRGVTDGAAHPM